jgi:hypothetical protein
MQRIAIGVRVNGHRLDAHFSRRLDDATGYFTAVGY